MEQTLQIILYLLQIHIPVSYTHLDVYKRQGLTQTVGGTFGGSTTQVTALTLGTGTFGTSTANASPFSFVYTPSVADIAAGTVTIKVVTNIPLGSPCRPDTNTCLLYTSRCV